jgi:hypothetical protein
MYKILEFANIEWLNTSINKQTLCGNYSIAIIVALQKYSTIFYSNKYNLQKIKIYLSCQKFGN